MSYLTCQVFADGDPASGFIGLLFIIGAIWLCVHLNKPKGYVIDSAGRTTVKPIK